MLQVWGDDAFEFKLRNKTIYEENIDVEWSGFAFDERYPKESHACPGLAMSKAMLKGFMRSFKCARGTTL